MTRKRFIKLMMASGESRNSANKLAQLAHRTMAYQLLYKNIIYTRLSYPMYKLRDACIAATASFNLLADAIKEAKEHAET